MKPSTLIACLASIAVAPAAAPRPVPAQAPFAKLVVELGGSPRQVEAGDVDGDADLDLVVLSASSNGSGLAVLLNDGSGGFAPGWSAVLPAQPVGGAVDLELGDLDADGDLDLVVNVPFAEAASRLNAGDGSFGAPQPIASAGQRVQNELGDLDGDPFPDNAYYELSIIGYVGAAKGSGSGTFGFGPETTGMAGDRFARTALGDVTGDGLEDLVLAAGPGLQLISGAPGGGIQTFAGVVDLDAGNHDDAAIADLDGDGRLDVVATRPGSNAVAVLLGPPSGPPTLHHAGRRPGAVCTADLNGDGRLDVAVTSGRGGTVELLLGAGGGALAFPVGIPVGRKPVDVTPADLDGDGDVDLAVVDELLGRLVLLVNQTRP